MPHDPRPQDLEDNLFFLCTQVVYRRTRALQGALKPLGILPTEFFVLSATLRKGPLTMQELAQWTAYERTRLTHLLHHMEAKAWVERTNLESDRRTVVVKVTPAGEDIFAQAKIIVDEITSTIVEDSPPAALAQTRSALQAMRHRLIAMDGNKKQR